MASGFHVNWLAVKARSTGRGRGAYAIHGDLINASTVIQLRSWLLSYLFLSNRLNVHLGWCAKIPTGPS
jgi:hypothetical protein